MSVSVAVTLPRSAEHIRTAGIWWPSGCGASGLPDEILHDMSVVVSEASSNAVRHALGCDEYHVAVKLDEGQCRAEWPTRRK